MRTSSKADLRGALAGVLAGVLVVLLALTGAGRGIAGGTAPQDAHAAASGGVAPICHAGPAAARSTAPGPATPDRNVDPDCCTACALLAAAIVPAAPALSRPGSVRVPASRIAAVAPAPEGTRARSPRQARAPPIG